MDFTKFNYKNNSISFFYLNNDLICKNWVEFHRFYEKDILEYIENLNLEGVYIDCGSHFGNHTVFFSKFTKADKIISIEGNPHNFSFLEKNILENNCKNVILYNKLIGDKDDENYQIGFPQSSLLSNKIKNTGRSHILQDENYKYSFDKVFTNYSLKLDTILEKENLNMKVSFIKFDVERFEYFALIGAEKTIASNKPILQIELHSDNPFYNNIIQFLEKLSYQEIKSFGKNKIFQSK